MGPEGEVYRPPADEIKKPQEKMHINVFGEDGHLTDEAIFYYRRHQLDYKNSEEVELHNADCDHCIERLRQSKKDAREFKPERAGE